jgi:transcriptional regulator of aromatic amino acid metabolism
MPANAKAVMDKVKRKQSLTPDEQKVMNMVALANESRRKLVREQNELHQAQVVLAAQDMIDRIQVMIEDISEMQFKDLPALVGSIKSDVGVDQAQQFQNDATQALSSLLQTMQQGKTEMETAQGVLTGQAPVVPGDTGIDGAAGNVMPDPELDTDLDVDAEVDVDVDDELSAGGEKDLGRARR